MAQKVVHFEVIGSDAKKLQDFYSQLFDWKIDANNPMNYGVVDAAEAGVGGGIASGQDPSQSHVTFYVEVDDLDAALEKVASLGGSTLMPPMDAPTMTVVPPFRQASRPLWISSM